MHLDPPVGHTRRSERNAADQMPINGPARHASTLVGSLRGISVLFVVDG